MDTEPHSHHPEEILADRAWIDGIGRALLGSDGGDEVEDAVQDTWLVAHRLPPRPRASLRAWLAGTLRHVAATARRGEARRARREAEAARPEALPSTDELVERAELQRILAEEVVALDEVHRQVVLLRYFEGLSSAEIARRTGAPAATVRSRLKRGLEKLRSRLDERTGGDRAAWCVPLLGLVEAVRPVVPASPGPADPASATDTLAPEVRPWSEWTWKGLLAMKGTLSIVIVGAVALTTAVVLVSRTRGSTPLPGEREVAEPERSALAPLAGGAGLRESKGATAERSALVASEPTRSPEVEPSVVGTERAPARVRARLVDPDGRPLAGGTISTEGGPVSAPSGPAGFCELDVPAVGEEWTEEVHANHAEMALLVEETRVRAGETTHLGDLVLAYAGAVMGVVVDEVGAPVSGAQVLVTGVETVRQDPEELRRLGPTVGAVVPTGSSGADGRFRVEGVPSGPARVWAGAPGRAWAELGPLEVDPTRPAHDVELVLALLRPDDRIEGVVLSPEGEPLAGIRVEYWYTAGHIGTGGAHLTEADGTFSFVVDHRVPHDLTAEDEDGRWASVYADSVAPGTPGLELRFRETGWMDVRGLDPDGEPVEGFSVSATCADPGRHDTLARGEDEGGSARLRVPTRSFEIHLDARGFEVAQRGPFSPDDVPAELRVDLVPLEGVHGRVLDPDGAPVAGVTVEMRRSISRGTTVVVNGFRSLVNSYADDRDESDVSGRFTLYPRTRDAYVLRAEPLGYVPSVLGPLDLGPGAAPDGLELFLTRGGGIRGRVLLPPGADESGLILGLSRGDGAPRTVRLGDDAAYHLEGLTPGPWELRLVDKEILPSQKTSTHLGSESPPVAWSCEVREGETTGFDLDLRDAEPCVVQGRVSLGGLPLDGWTASLERQTIDHLAPEIPSTHPLDGDGRFRLEAPRPGDYAVRVRGSEAASGRLVLERRLELVRGVQEVEIELEVGSVVGDGIATREGVEELHEYRWRGGVEGDVTGLIRIVADPDGRFELGVVPAGPAKIHVYEPGGGQRFGTWRTAASFVVEAGERAEVQVR